MYQRRLNGRGDHFAGSQRMNQGLPSRAGKGMANAKTISQNFSISKTLPLYVYLQGFYLLYGMPNHFHVEKGKKKKGKENPRQWS